MEMDGHVVGDTERLLSMVGGRQRLTAVHGCLSATSGRAANVAGEKVGDGRLSSGAVVVDKGRDAWLCDSISDSGRLVVARPRHVSSAARAAGLSGWPVGWEERDGMLQRVGRGEGRGQGAGGGGDETRRDGGRV